MLGLTPSLRVEADSLREAFYDLSRKVHPDKFATVPAPQPSYALRWSTAVNRAYQTLRDPVQRAHYLLELEGTPVGAQAQVPLDLAETYFDLQDYLSEPGGEEKMAGFRSDLQQQLDGPEGEWNRIAEAWDKNENRAATAAELQALLTRQRYLRSMIADLERKGSHGHRGD